MRWFPFLCRHNRVALKRRHPATCKDIAHKAAWMDEHGCLNFIQCEDCGTFLTTRTDGVVYGTQKPE